MPHSGNPLKGAPVPQQGWNSQGEASSSCQLSPAFPKSPVNSWQNWGQTPSHAQASVASWPPHPTPRMRACPRAHPPAHTHPQHTETNIQALSLTHLPRPCGPHSRSFGGHTGNLGYNGMTAHDPRNPWQRNKSLRQRERVGEGV